MPIASNPAQMKSPSEKAQRNEVIPLSILGGRKCTGRLYRASPTQQSESRNEKEEPHGVSRTGPKKFAEPVALSSTASADFRLPATTFGFSFDLLALRARRKRESRGPQGSHQGVRKRHGRNLRIFLFSTFPQPFVHRVDKAVDATQRGGRRRQTGATRGSVTRSTSRTSDRNRGSASLQTTTAQASPTSAPATTSPG